MFIRIYGPNLYDQSKGEFHVHAEGCGDCKHYGPDKRFGGDDLDGWAVEASSRKDVVEAIYEDQISENCDHGDQPEDEYIALCESTIFFAPCVKQLG